MSVSPGDEGGNTMNVGDLSGRTEVTDLEGVLQLRFRDEDNNLTELSAADVAQVLQGLVGIASDFAKAGVFGDGLPGTLKVRPPREGSFIIEVTNWIQQNPDLAAIAGVPSLGSIIAWATKSARAQVSDAKHLDNGNVMVYFQDNTSREIPVEAWQELNKREQRRKKQLKEIMAPLSNPEVSTLEVREAEEPPGEEVPASTPTVAVLDVEDYRAVVPMDEIEETHRVFEAEAQMVTVDFDSGKKWRVRVPGSQPRIATVEDTDFLAKVDHGLALHKTDIFRLQIREDATIKNGRSRTTWTVLRVVSHRRGGGDADDS